MVRRPASTGSPGQSRVAKSLWPQVAELRAAGKTNKQIAQAIERGEAAVCRTLQEPEVIADIDRIQEDRRRAVRQLMLGRVEAIVEEVYRIALESDDGDAVRLRACTDQLDRLGFAAPKSVELSGPAGAPVQVVTMTPADLVKMTPDQLRAVAAVAEEAEEGQP